MDGGQDQTSEETEQNKSGEKQKPHSGPLLTVPAIFSSSPSF